ncbi:cation transporter [Butyrivibrio sp. X503]|uniref:cation diffusion facilitator family transporter n=1 Tax=Butyrivibrio sp. X503 TaxID=2364878 RepID=UPI000EA8B6B1|nr:cation diffusion facilitator family transporter [Butyrivibrio sp. X503]RKM56999.1 cation transporter [Butyrivibrio sp. X503]
MISFLAAFFIKDHNNTDDLEVRNKYGILSGIVGICLNIILFSSKLFAGIVSSSISIMGDAFNNLSDAASCIVTLVGFKLSGQEADEEHPFGHGRLEYVAGLIVALFIVIMGVELMQSSVEKIIHPKETLFNGVIAGILIFSIIIKLIMFHGNLEASKKIGSAALKNTAMDSISDVITTGIVLVSAFISHKTGIILDGYIGVIACIFIIKTGYEAAKDTISPLLGEPPSKELVKEIEDFVLDFDGILGVHDLVIHNYGPGRNFVSLHVEVPGDKDIVTVHDLVDDIENEIRTKYGCMVVIHMDPVVTGDEYSEELKRKVTHIVAELDPKLSFHDFRVIHAKGDCRRVAFDILVPYKYDLKDAEIIKYLDDHIKGAEPGIECDITIDKVNDKIDDRSGLVTK